MLHPALHISPLGRWMNLIPLLILMQNTGITCILHELEVFICKALKGEAIVYYASLLITQQMEASSLPCCSQGEN